MEGNNKAMREALEFIKLASDDYEKYGTTKAGALDVIYEKACAALAAPARNCDIGTADEQTERVVSFCDKNGRIDGVPRCEVCPLLNARDCSLVWAQMPYKEGGKK